MQLLLFTVMNFVFKSSFSVHTIIFVSGFLKGYYFVAFWRRKATWHRLSSCFKNTLLYNSDLLQKFYSLSSAFRNPACFLFFILCGFTVTKRSEEEKPAKYQIPKYNGIWFLSGVTIFQNQSFGAVSGHGWHICMLITQTILHPIRKHFSCLKYKL